MWYINVVVPVLLVVKRITHEWQNGFAHAPRDSAYTGPDVEKGSEDVCHCRLAQNGRMS